MVPSDIKILYESADQLAIISSARTFRALGAILLAAGLFIGLAFVRVG